MTSKAAGDLHPALSLADRHLHRQLALLPRDSNKHQYKAATVIPMLVDIVSKNGNLMLSVPVRGDEPSTAMRSGSCATSARGSMSTARRFMPSALGSSLAKAPPPWFEKGQFDAKSDTQRSVNARRHPVHPVERRRDALRHCARGACRWNRHHPVAGGTLAVVARPNRQRPNAGRPPQIEINRDSRGLHIRSCPAQCRGTSPSH